MCSRPTEGALETSAAPRLAAGVLLRDLQGRYLLAKPTYEAGWDIPGGHAEPGESPRRAAERELQEELRLEVPVSRLLVVDWAPHPVEGDKLLFVFDGGAIDSDVIAVVPDGIEIEEAGFFEADVAVHLLRTRTASRFRSAVRVLNGGGVTYLEHGNAPG